MKAWFSWVLLVGGMLGCGENGSSNVGEVHASAQAATAQPTIVAEQRREDRPAIRTEAASSANASPIEKVVATTERPSLCPNDYRCDYELLERAPKTKVASVRVEKGKHRMHLLDASDTVVKSYTIAIGYGGAGPKLREGDAVTPVGEYKITGKLDKSPWHILLGVSYPNYEDVKRHARLKAEGKIPADAGIGFGIAVHGRRKEMPDGLHKLVDWTLGCVALDNFEIEEVAKLVKPGTKIVIVD